MIRSFRIIHLGNDDYGVYASHQRGEYGTPLVYRGNLEDCLLYRSIHQ